MCVCMCVYDVFVKLLVYCFAAISLLCALAYSFVLIQAEHGEKDSTNAFLIV